MRMNRQELEPGRHVVSIFIFVTLLPLVYYIPPWLTRNVTDDRFLVTVLALATIVPIVSYVALPFLFKTFEMFKKR